MITCDQHDYIEIVCTFQYPIKLTMKQKTIIHCIAIDTTLNTERVECIKVDIGGEKKLVVLSDISTLEICINNPHFNTVCFD